MLEYPVEYRIKRMNRLYENLVWKYLANLKNVNIKQSYNDKIIAKPFYELKLLQHLG